tara:strand:- start:87 stop:1094 length:1008 start_codon:yes stop_codon:yes gene_type:complete
MSVNEFINLLIEQVNYKINSQGLSRSVLDANALQILQEQPTVEAAIAEATLLLSGVMTVDEISRLSQGSGQPQVQNYPQDITTQGQTNVSFLGDVPSYYTTPTGRSIAEKDDDGEYVFYTQGEQFSNFEGFSPEVRATIQTDLVNAGLLERGAFRIGEWDNASAAAMKIVLGRSNLIGNPDWVSSMKWYVDNQLPEIPTSDDIFLPPDYTGTANLIDGMFAQSLGREPKEYEKQNLLDEYNGIVQKQAANQQRVAGLIEEPEFQTVEQLVDYSNHGIEDIQETIIEEGITQIDPSARFQKAFKDATQFETERLRGQADIQRTNQTILNLISGAPG